MLIRVNNKTWVRSDDINKVYIAHANILGKHETRFSVDVETNDNGIYSELFDTFKDAENYASQIVAEINAEREK